MSCEDVETHGITLAQNPRVGSVSLCGCGTIHLSLGAVSLRVSPDVLVEVTRMLQVASNKLLQHSRAIETASEMVQ